MRNSISSELERKLARHAKEIEQARSIDVRLHQPLPPKKPAEFNFSRENIEGFEYPISIGNTLLEKKSDGFCVHVSVDQKSSQKVKIYSSQSNEWDPRCFPEVLKEILKLPSGYYHGEILGAKPKGAARFNSLDEYNAIKRRPTSNPGLVDKKLTETYPLKLDIFDALRIGRKNLLGLPLNKRRRQLENIVELSYNLQLSLQWDVKDAKSLQKLFLDVISKGYEGLVAKDPSSLYIPGSRDNDWVKLKDFLTLDLAVLGFYSTPESKKAGKPFSAMLVGSYNPENEMFETLAKVKVSRKKDQETIYEKVKDRVINTNSDYAYAAASAKSMVFSPEMKKISRKIPDRIIKYGNCQKIAVVEVQVQDVTYNGNWHSCGLCYDGERAHSLRIPTFKQLRTDKDREMDVTTTQQIHGMYCGE